MATPPPDYPKYPENIDNNPRTQKHLSLIRRDTKRPGKALSFREVHQKRKPRRTYSLRSDSEIQKYKRNSSLQPEEFDDCETSTLGSVRYNVSVSSSTGTYIGPTVSIYNTNTELLNVLKEKTKSTLIQHNKTETFARTTGFDRAVSKLLCYRKLVLTSGHGGGKTFVGKELLSYFSQSDKDDFTEKTPLIIVYPHDWHFVVKPSDHLIILLDDIFGKCTADETSIREWDRVLPDIHTCINDDNTSVYVIFTIRDNILRQLEKKLAQYDLFRNLHMFLIHLTDSKNLTNDDKEILLSQHFSHPSSKSIKYIICKDDSRLPDSHNSIIVPEKIFRTILGRSLLFIFPLCCREFVNNYFHRGPQFFVTPAELLLPDMMRLCEEDKNVFILLSLILFSESQTLKLDLYRSHSYKKFIENISELCSINSWHQQMFTKISELNGIYVLEKRNNVNFAYEAVLQVAIHIVGDKNMSFLLTNLELGLLLSHITANCYIGEFNTLSDTERIWKEEYNAALVNNKLKVHPKYYHTLIIRFTSEIQKGFRNEVIRSDVFESSQFIEQFINYLKTIKMFKALLRKERHIEGLLSVIVQTALSRNELIKQIMDNAPPKRRLLMKRQSKLANWFKSEVFKALKIACQTGKTDYCRIMTKDLKRVPVEILYTAAECQDSANYIYLLEKFKWSEEEKRKANKKHKSF